MPVIEIISWILGITVTASLCLWVGLGYRLWVMNKSKPVIREGLDLPNPKGESVSIVVPVHNEERVIDCCAESLRNQTHRDLQIIFVLDRCTDKTRGILQKHADEDDRVCLIENDHCPEGWAGKCNAARVGAAKATGEWLLFTDADTQFDKELVRCSVASAIKRGASLLSLLSSLTITKNFERIVQPIASTFLVRQYPVDRVNRAHKPRPFANGQFLLFSRKLYEEIGGHNAVKEFLLEDIAFARHICYKNLGKVQILFADGMLKCSMYPTFAAFQNGWKRIYIEAATRNVKRLRQSALLAILVGLIFPIAGIAGIYVGLQTSPSLFWTSIASLIAAVLVIAWLYRINNAPIIFALFAPIGAAVVAKMFFDSVQILKERTPIRWGGKEYILEPKKL
jgi:chlorobactene glucosyltransferase